MTGLSSPASGDPHNAATDWGESASESLHCDEQEPHGPHEWLRDLRRVRCPGTSVESAATELLCGHWTFFGMSTNRQTARCDLPQGHEGDMHKFWTNPAAGESFSWSEAYECHERSAVSAY